MENLETLVRSIESLQFAGWARNHYNRQKQRLDGNVLASGEMTDNFLWHYVTKELGMTAVGIGSSGHAVLILKMEPEKTKIYDPMRGVCYRPTKKILAEHLMPSNDLMPMWAKNNQDLKDYLLGDEYELNLNDDFPRIQKDSCNCGPLSLYAALIANASTPKYAEKLNTDAIKEIKNVLVSKPKSFWASLRAWSREELKWSPRKPK